MCHNRGEYLGPQQTWLYLYFGKFDKFVEISPFYVFDHFGYPLKSKLKKAHQGKLGDFFFFKL